MAAVPAAASTRDRLLDAAVEVFVEQGFESARVQDIARAAGLTTGAIYANFRGKSELLFDAMGARANAEMLRTIHDWSGLFARHWRGQLRRIKAHAEEKR